MSKRSHVAVGLAALAFGIFLAVIGIPYGVTSPSNIRNVVLSPVFWPYTLAGALVLGALGLLLASRRLPESEAAGSPPPLARGSVLRLAGAGVLMVLYVALAETLGLVWTSMLAFAGLALLVKTEHPVTALAAAVAVPLALYAFFAHVAGVAIPQGAFVRLP